MSRAMQYTLDGGIEVSGNVVDKMTAILEDDPAARTSYKRAIGSYWIQFDGLAHVLGDRADAFLDWLERHATSPKTLQNRCMEIQTERPDLEAPPEVERIRQRQSRAGRVLR